MARNVPGALAEPGLIAPLGKSTTDTMKAASTAVGAATSMGVLSDTARSRARIACVLACCARAQRANARSSAAPDRQDTMLARIDRSSASVSLRRSSSGSKSRRPCTWTVTDAASTAATVPAAMSAEAASTAIR